MRNPHGSAITAIPVTKKEREELRECMTPRKCVVIDGAGSITVGVDQFYGIDLYEHPDAKRIRNEK